MKNTLLVIFYFICLASFGQTGSNTKLDISIIAPYYSNAHIASVNEAYSETDSCPWGFVHGGIDFFPDSNFRPFCAIASGVVDTVILVFGGTNWQVNMAITYNETYSYCYAFEPFSPNQSDGETQLANIKVTSKQTVNQGDTIGKLLVTANGSHVHFGFSKGGIPTCPEEYFTPQARDSVLFVIHKNYPLWNMCYLDTTIHVSTNNYEEGFINVYPNPFQTLAVINVSPLLITHELELTMYDCLGHEVKHIKNISSHEIVIDRKEIPNGVYFYILRNKEKIVAQGKLMAN